MVTAGLMRSLKNRVTPSLFFLFSAQLISRTAAAAISPVFPIYMRSLGFAIADLGIVSMSLGVALIVFEPLWGSLINRLGAKKIFLLSTLLMALVLFSYALVSDLTGFLLVRFLTGVVGSANAVSTRTLVWQVIPRKERAFGVWYTISAAAGVIGPIIGGILATQGYIITFYASAAIAAAALFLSFWTPESNSTEFVDTGSTIRGMDKVEKMVLLVASALIVMPFFLRTVYLTFVPVFAKESAKFLLDPVEIGIVVAAMGVAGFLAPLVFSDVAGKKGVKNVIVMGMVMQVCAFLLLPIVSGFSALCLTAALLGLGEAAISPCMMAFLIGKTRFSNRGLAIGVYGAAEDVGILTGPLVIGYLYQGYSAEFSFFFTAALMVANIVIAIPLFRETV
jgi:MFS family permease